MILTIVLSVLAAWLLVSVLLALVIGRAIHLADKDHRRKIAYRATPAAAPRATAPRARAAS
ncbi:hypothetical protein [Amnibacterium kyonggiense]|uniref:Uncharacterized protein n=1 Tax=Amnibacterium kyonggiense TaxID=595671 RepID=A0A4R7FFG3_9MICO|nr:hypothetical protein [Amnibacterium kyonggiense]TDS74931.1 hypothetical protein CLV52_3455 [Amnibacterium kyonggiense]